MNKLRNTLAGLALALVLACWTDWLLVRPRCSIPTDYHHTPYR